MVRLGLWKGLSKEWSPEPGPKPRQSEYTWHTFIQGFPHHERVDQKTAWSKHSIHTWRRHNTRTKDIPQNSHLSFWPAPDPAPKTYIPAMSRGWVDQALLRAHDEVIGITRQEAEAGGGHGLGLLVLQLHAVLGLWQHVQAPRAQFAVVGHWDQVVRILRPYHRHAIHRVLQTHRKRRACCCCTPRSGYVHILTPYHCHAIHRVLQTHRKKSLLSVPPSCNTWGAANTEKEELAVVGQRSGCGHILHPYHHHIIHGVLQTHRKRRAC